MVSKIIKHIGFAFLIIFFQIVVFNNLGISAYLVPFIYPSIIISLPRTANKSLVLLLGFSIGLIIDLFSNSGGTHAMGLTVMAFLQPHLLASMGPSDSSAEKNQASIYSLGFKNYLVFALILLFVHHFVVFTMEVFSFSNFNLTLIRVIFSTISSLVLLVLLQFIFVRKQKK